MKKLLYLVFITFIFIGCEGAYKQQRPVLHEAQAVALDDFYRKLTGYDSVEMIFFMGKWKPNFCYPNEWMEAIPMYGIDTVRFKYWKEHDGIKIKNQNGDALMDNATKTVYNK